MQRIDAGARVGHGNTVQGRAVGHVSGIGRGIVPQTRIYGILCTDVFDGDGVSQGFAGHQNVGIP